MYDQVCKLAQVCMQFLSKYNYSYKGTYHVHIEFSCNYRVNELTKFIKKSLRKKKFIKKSEKIYRYFFDPTSSICKILISKS
jgi:hypothetical protein